MTYHPVMSDAIVPTSDFSPAKARLSDVMTQVFHGHQPQLVSRHRGKEQMLLVRPDDLVGCRHDTKYGTTIPAAAAAKPCFST